MGPNFYVIEILMRKILNLQPKDYFENSKMAKISIEKFELFIVLKDNYFKISNKTVEDTLSSIQKKFNIYFDEKILISRKI